MWLYNPIGYHQLVVALASQKQLAFQWPDAIKWTYTVMPFSPTNGPAMFVNFIYDVDSQWKSLAQTEAIDIGNDTNTRMIIGKIVSHGKYLQTRVASQDAPFDAVNPSDSPSNADVAHHLHCQSVMAVIFHHNCHGL